MREKSQRLLLEWDKICKTCISSVTNPTATTKMTGVASKSSCPIIQNSNYEPKKDTGANKGSPLDHQERQGGLVPLFGCCTRGGAGRARTRLRCGRRLRQIGRAVQREYEHDRRVVHFRIVGRHDSGAAAQAFAERHILLAVHFVCDRRSHAGASNLHLVQDLALIGTDRTEAAIVDCLKHQIACSSYSSAADAAATFDVPLQLLVERIPSLQPAARAFRRLGSEGWLNRLCLTRRTNVTRRTRPVFCLSLIREALVGRGNVNQSGIEIVGHRCPVVTAAACWIDRDRILIVICGGIDHRPAIPGNAQCPA